MGVEKHMRPGTPRDPAIVIIGAGMTGILLAIKLEKAGFQNVRIFEKRGELGGTWRENTYPGVACDIPAHMYTYSFEPNPEWQHRFARGSEILAYFRRMGEKYGVRSRIHFNEAVVSSVYERGRWTLATSQGREVTADFVIAATGILHHPAKPAIEGLDSFQGQIFHTAEWDHSVPLAGRRLGVIGTGSTAAQVIPELVKVAGKVSVFQRTPQWIVHVPDKLYSDKHRHRWRHRPELAARLHRWYTRAVEATFSNAVIGKKLPFALLNFLCRWHLWKAVKDPALRAKLTPQYRVGCKRVIVNSSFYPAIQRPNADLVTEGIQRISDKGVLTRDGRLHELDVLILATGFHPFHFMRPMQLRGKGGRSIDEVWGKKAQAYRSLFIPGFPNFCLMLGPNTPIGNFSVIAMSEVQSDYVLRVLNDWRAHKFDEIDATPAALQRFGRYLKEGMKKTVWVGGCQSWYLDADGDPAMWPYSWKQWVREMSEPDYRDFALQSFSGEERAREFRTSPAPAAATFALESQAVGEGL